jgi:hypothetical protein
VSHDINGLLLSYLEAKRTVIASGFENEISWQERVEEESPDETCIVREAAWVILSAGMREQIIRRKFPALTSAFFSFSVEDIQRHRRKCRRDALRTFRHEGKIDAIVFVADDVRAHGATHWLETLRRIGPDWLRRLPFLGPATSRHLAKNLGVPCAKPDRHLLRIAERTGFKDPEDLCQRISIVLGDSVAVVDLVLWRFATLRTDYLQSFANT